MKVLASRISELRTEFRLSSERLARLVDVSNKSIVTWEKNRGDPSLKNLLAIAGVFGVTPDYLLGISERDADAGRRLAVLLAEEAARREMAETAEADPLEEAQVHTDDDRVARRARRAAPKPKRAAG